MKVTNEILTAEEVEKRTQELFFQNVVMHFNICVTTKNGGTCSIPVYDDEFKQKIELIKPAFARKGWAVTVVTERKTKRNINTKKFLFITYKEIIPVETKEFYLSFSPLPKEKKTIKPKPKKKKK